jgi:hypothetical protein
VVPKADKPNVGFSSDAALLQFEAAHYTVQLIGYATDLRSAAQTLAAHGHPVSRAPLADASLDF